MAHQEDPESDSGAEVAKTAATAFLPYATVSGLDRIKPGQEATVTLRVRKREHASVIGDGDGCEVEILGGDAQGNDVRAAAGPGGADVRPAGGGGY